MSHEDTTERSWLRHDLQESSYTDMMDSPCSPSTHHLLTTCPALSTHPHLLRGQPLPANASPIAASPGYVADSDPDEDPEDDQANYSADERDGDDEPSNDDDDDDDTDSDPDKDLEEEPFEEEEDGEEEEEHLASADSSVVPIVDLVLPDGDTEALEADEPTPTLGSPYIIIPLSQTRLCRARKIVRPEPSMSASMKACIARHADLPSPPLHVPSLPLPLPSPLTTSPTDTRAPLGYRAAGIRMRALLLSTSRRTNIPEAEVPPRKRACLTTPAPGFEVRESSAAGAARGPRLTESDLRRYRVEQAGYGNTDTWDRIVDTLMKIAPTTLEGEAHDDQAFLRARVNTMFKDRPNHRCTAMLLDREAMYAREVWAGSKDRSAAIAAHVRTLEAQKMAPKKRTMRATPATTPTTTITDAQLQAQIDRGVPMSFQGTEGVVGSALIWWNSHMRAVRQDVAYAMPWAALKRMITDKYCPVESAKVERYISGLPDMIHGSVKGSKPQSMQKAIEFAFEMMEKKMLTHAERDKKPYGGTNLICPKCDYHHDGPCAPKCTNCKKIGHLACDCKGRPAATTTNNNTNTNNNNNSNNNNQRSQGENARGINCVECGVQGHYKSDCPKLKNGNQAGNKNVVARAYTVGTTGTHPNSNVVTGTFPLNDRYASILFDTGADRSFISTAFCSLINIIPTTLDHGYDVE
nr:hypothetical protein [Tanacetum cinerariifolium]